MVLLRLPFLLLLLLPLLLLLLLLLVPPSLHQRRLMCPLLQEEVQKIGMAMQQWPGSPS